MNIQLLKVINMVKKALDNDPSGIVYGELSVGVSDIKKDNLYLNQYFEFLGESNGARCGAIDIWSTEELMSNQYRPTDFIGGQDKWLEVGQVTYESLVVDKYTGKVHLFYQGQPEIIGRSFDDFDVFLLEYVFGSKYKEIVPDADSDDWYQMLKNIGLV